MTQCLGNAERKGRSGVLFPTFSRYNQSCSSKGLVDVPAMMINTKLLSCK